MQWSAVVTRVCGYALRAVQKVMQGYGGSKTSGEEQRKQLINRRQQCQGPVVGAIGCVTQFEHDNNNPLTPGGGRLFR